MNSMIPIYDRVFSSLQKQGVTHIRCDELFARYSSSFADNYALFELCLDYWEKEGKVSIERVAVAGETFNTAITLLE